MYYLFHDNDAKHIHSHPPPNNYLQFSDSFIVHIQNYPPFIPHLYTHRTVFVMHPFRAIIDCIRHLVMQHAF